MVIPGMGPAGEGGMDIDFQGMLEKILPKNVVRRDMTVAEARRVLFDQECDALINQEKVNAKAIELAESTGMIASAIRTARARVRFIACLLG